MNRTKNGEKKKKQKFSKNNKKFKKLFRLHKKIEIFNSNTKRKHLKMYLFCGEKKENKIPQSKHTFFSKTAILI